MTAVFNRNVTFGGSFPADQVRMDLSGIGLTRGAVVQQFNAQYAQRVRRMWDVTSSDIYYVGGRTEGQISVGRVIGPKAITCVFYGQVGNICNARKNTLKFSTGAAAEGDCVAIEKIDFVASFCLLTQIALGVTAEEMLISDNGVIMVGMLEMSNCS